MEDEDDSLDYSDEEVVVLPRKGVFQFPPTQDEVEQVVISIKNILWPPREDTRIAYKSSGLDKHTEKRLREMLLFGRKYLELLSGSRDEPHSGSHSGIWTKASIEIGRLVSNIKKGSKNPGNKKARNLKTWVRRFIEYEELPVIKWNNFGRSHIDDEDLAQEIYDYLQFLKPQNHEICAQDVVHFLDTPAMLERLGRQKTISLTTARRWMRRMGYRWDYDPKGQYVDGHERDDVVTYRQEIYLPRMEIFQQRLRIWGSDGVEIHDPEQMERPVVFWFHDESTFYANDRRHKRWIHETETAKPYAKGEGASYMAVDFVSADYGWLQSPDGTESARILFRPGKGRDGYFDNESIRAQTKVAMHILERYYPQEEHILIFDNARTHSKRAETSLSALRMPKGPSKSFMVEINETGDNGRPVFGTDGKIKKKKVKMSNGLFSDGREQEFYFPENHPKAGWFKGMATILEERGYQNASSLKASCGTSLRKCPNPDGGPAACCCRRLLFYQTDFLEVNSVLETDVKAQGFQLLFLPKFHCELNPIEQCWGYAKRMYRLLPPSSNEEKLRENVEHSLNQVPLLSMRRFVTRSLRFMDAYRKGLTGAQAAWACKRYRGHRMIPDSILFELENANVV